jgi:hypothetical protein
MRTLRAWLLALPLLGGCAVVAGLGDFVPDDDDDSGGNAASAGATGGVGPGSGGTGPASGGAGGGTGGGPSTSSASGMGGFGGASCFDGDLNGSETDIDCGGASCPPCKVGDDCNTGSDCVTTRCGPGDKCVCNDHLVISEVRTRGPGGAADDFVEIYNATSAPLTLVANEWTIESRSAGGANYTARWASSGETIPPYEHYLVVGNGYTGSPAGDAVLSASISDDASVRLKNQTVVVDAVCFCHDPVASGSCDAVTAAGFSCEGQPVINPNDGTENLDASLERKAGGQAGNCVDTIDNAADFAASMPAKPQSSTSLPAP